MMHFSDHSKHVYAYDATGRKLRAEYHTPIMVVAEPQVPDMGEEMPEQEEVLMEEQQEWNEEEWEEQEQEEEWTELEHEEEPLPHYLPPLIPQNGEDEPIAVVPNGNEPVIDEVPCEVTTVDYCGDFIYVNNVLKRVLFPGGYVTFRNDSIECPEYHFYITDHQGNVRVVANQNGEVEQVNHYYPYGGLMGESTNSDTQPYKYNGKELDRHHGLDWYDYGARWYNGISWMNPDPHAESYYDVTPYGYCHNNPMNKIDPTGMDDYRFDNLTGVFHLMKKTNDKTDRVLKYHLNKKTGEYEQNKKWYQTKVQIENVEKGILSDGINFRDNDNIISIGELDSPTVQGVKSFVLAFSELIGKELKGYSYSADGSGNITDILLGKYKNNTFNKSFGIPRELQYKYGESFSFHNIFEDFHTHPNGELGATLLAPEQSTDVRLMQKDKYKVPNARFIILYRIFRQEKPGEYDYTQ